MTREPIAHVVHIYTLARQEEKNHKKYKNSPKCIIRDKRIKKCFVSVTSTWRYPEGRLK